MTSKTERLVEVWNGKITLKVRVAGHGPALVYLHPAAGLLWDPFLDHLAEHYTIYAPEFPGTTQGDPYAIHQIEEIWDVVLLYEEAIRKLGLSRPILIGQSFGGMLAAELAASFPGICSRLVLFDAIGLWRDDAPVANWIAADPSELPAMLFKDPQGEAAKAMLAMPEDPEAALMATVGLVWTLGCTGKFCWPIPDRGLAKRLHRITAPTLIVWGADDALVSAVYAQDYARHIAGAEVAIVENCGHIPQVEQMDETLALVSAFLNGSRADAA